MKAFVLKLEVGSAKAEVIVGEHSEVSIIGLDARRQVKKALLRFISCCLSDGVFTRTSRTVSGDVLECVRRVSSDETIFPQVLCDAINEEEFDCGSVFAYIPDVLLIEEPDLNIHGEVLKQVLQSRPSERLGWMASDAVDLIASHPIGSFSPDGAYVIKLPNAALPTGVSRAQIEGVNFFGYAINNDVVKMTHRDAVPDSASGSVRASA